MNRTFKFNTLYIGILLLVLAFSSCTSSKQLAIQKSKTAQLSRKLGFTVNRKDDLPLLEEVSRWLGTPYRYGGTPRTGADCSGFAGAVYKNVYHKSLQRTVVNIYNKDCQRIGKRRLKPGDLVFFNFSKRKKCRFPVDHLRYLPQKRLLRSCQHIKRCHGQPPKRKLL